LYASQNGKANRSDFAFRATPQDTEFAPMHKSIVYGGVIT